MTKKKKSRVKGLLSDSETQFLYMTEAERKKNYGEGSRKKYQRMVESANRGFQDYVFLVKHLPKRHLENIEFVSGLRYIHQSLSKAKATEQIPYVILDTARDNLESCLPIIRKQHSHRLEKIAEKDFEIVKEWLEMAQKYPKEQGAPT